MSGISEFNYPAFNREAARLRALGYQVENPAENPAPPCGTWDGWMALGKAQLVQCDTIVLLPGWTASPGAKIEVRDAIELGLTIKMAHEVMA